MQGSHRRHGREASESGRSGVSYHRALRSLSRRQILNVAWKLGAAAALQPLARATASAQAPTSFTDYPFTLGVASGDPWPDSVVLWTRLAPDPLNGGGMPMVSVPVAWEVAHDERFTQLVQSGAAMARPELGHSVHVEVNGLAAGREYWYRFHAGHETSATGRTKTAPAEGAAIDRLRFAVCGCSNFQSGYFTPLAHLAAERFDFVFHTGDYIYESRGNPNRNPPSPRAHIGDELFTLGDYRTRYAQYKRDPDLMAAHASAPFIVTWDDHEVDNDYAGDVDERETPPEVFLLRRAAAYQAYFEAMPLRIASIPHGPSMRLYRRLRFGRLIDLSVLDTRQHRADQACGHGAATNCEATADDSRSMLGAEQERWLLAQMADVRSTWTIIGQQVPMWGHYEGPDPASGAMDKWDGYPHSRQRLFSRLIEARTPNPIVLSGDTHVHFGSDLAMDFRNANARIVGTELTNSSISSGGDGSEMADYWDRMKAENPHLKFHSGRRGYIACTASPDEMRADFMVVDRVSEPECAARRAGSLVVEAGRTGAVTD
jgi:alkaline phosphatase D